MQLKLDRHDARAVNLHVARRRSTPPADQALDSKSKNWAGASIESVNKATDTYMMHATSRGPTEE